MRLLTRCLPSVVTLLAHSGAFSGAISVLTRALNIFILWILFRHHIHEVHISHLTGEIQKAQGGVFMPVCWRHSLPASLKLIKSKIWKDSTGESYRLARWLLKLRNSERELWLWDICCPTICITLDERYQTSTSINLVPAMKHEILCAHVFSWTCLSFRSSYCIGSELDI